MAPRSSYKKRVKFSKSRSPIPRKKIASSADSYANIVLHYLSKLKGLFTTNPERSMGNRENSYDNISKPVLRGRTETRYSERNPDSTQKAYDIVTAAIQYGCANDIIEKVGNYFLIKNQLEKKVTRRAPTPGPDYIRCASCKNLAKYSGSASKTFRGRDKISRNFQRRSSYDRHGRKRKRSRSSDVSVVSYCAKCYSRMKPNKKL